MGTPDAVFIDTPNGALAVRRTGSGPPMMVIPGGPGFGCDYLLRPIVELLSAEHDLVFVEQRGAGASAAGDGPLTMDAYVEDMEAIADALDLDRFDVFGNSFGGLQSQYFAIAHPERVRRMILADSDGPTGSVWRRAVAPGGVMYRRVRQQDVDEIARIEQIDGWMDDPDLFQGYLAATFRHWYVDPTTVDSIEHGLTPERYLQLGETSKQVRGSIGDWDISSDLQGVEAATLILACRDSILGSESPVMLDDLLPNSTLVWVEGGHLPFVEDRDAFVDAVAEFFAAH